PDLCPPKPYAGVDALDLGRHSLALLWRLTHGNVIGGGVGWELRSDPLSRKQVVIDAGGYVGDGEIDVPESPNALGQGALFLERLGGYTVTRSTITSFDPAGNRFRQAVPFGLAYAVARDANTLYWISGPRPQPNQPPTVDACRTAPNACVL